MVKGDRDYPVNRRTALRNALSASAVIATGIPTLSTLVSGRTNRIIENFEDRDLSEYDGEVSKFEIQSEITFRGNAGLKGAANIGEIRSTSGLLNYPSQGDLFDCRVLLTNVGSGATVVMFGVQDESNHYRINLDKNNGELRFVRNTPGSSRLLAKDTVNYFTNIWYRVKVDWRTNGTIAVTLFDNEDQWVGGVTVTDDTFEEGGIGFSIINLQIEDEHYFDLYKMTNM